MIPLREQWRSWTSRVRIAAILASLQRRGDALSAMSQLDLILYSRSSWERLPPDLRSAMSVAYEAPPRAASHDPLERFLNTCTEDEYNKAAGREPEADLGGEG